MPKITLVNIKVSDKQREAIHEAAAKLNMTGGVSEFTRKAWMELDPKLKEVFDEN